MPNTLVWMVAVTQRVFTYSLPSAIFTKLTIFFFLNSVRVLPHTQTQRRPNSFSDEWLLYSSGWISCSKFGKNTTSRTQSKMRQDVNTFCGHKTREWWQGQPTCPSVKSGYQVLVRVLLLKPKKYKTTSLSLRTDNIVGVRTHAFLIA